MRAGTGFAAQTRGAKVSSGLRVLGVMAGWGLVLAVATCFAVWLPL